MLPLEIRRLKELKALRDAELVPEIEYRDAVRLALGLAPIGTETLGRVDSIQQAAGDMVAR